MKIKKAILKSFNSTTYTANVQISGSARAYLEGLTVARNLATVDMQAGRKVVVLFWDEHNPSDAVIIAVYT